MEVVVVEVVVVVVVVVPHSPFHLVIVDKVRNENIVYLHFLFCLEYTRM